MTEEKQGLLDELQDMPNPADGEIDPPTFEESMDDLQHEVEEYAGRLPVPYKTVPFWLSLIATILAYVLASQLITADTQLWMVLTFVSSAFAHMGYDRTLKIFGSSSSYFQPNSDKPAYKKPTYYISFIATLAGYGLGSGLAGSNLIIQGSGLVAVILGYVGINVTAWIKRSAMEDPSNPTDSFWVKLYSIVYNAIRGSAPNAPLPDAQTTETPELPASETSEPVEEESSPEESESV